MQPLNQADLAALRTLEDFENAAQSHMRPAVFEYVAGSAGAGGTTLNNLTGWSKLPLWPRVLVDVSHIDTSIRLFGRTHNFPILLAPTGYHKLIHPDGELETVRGAEESGVLLVAASFSTVAIEEMAAMARQPLWFQLYFLPDRNFTRQLVERALASGCQAICVTVDVPVNGPRDRELRAGFSLPAGMERENISMLGPQIAAGAHRPSGRDIYAPTRAADVTWADIDWLRRIVRVPLLIKGILHPADAGQALNSGCDGVVVSNHGGRSVDSAISAVEALPHIVKRLNGSIPVIVDGGIRRGTDVFKALALGASAVMIGRPYLYGLAVAGSAGVARVVEVLRTELEMTMGFMGCPSLPDIKKERIYSEQQASE